MLPAQFRAKAGVSYTLSIGALTSELHTNKIYKITKFSSYAVNARNLNPLSFIRHSNMHIK